MTDTLEKLNLVAELDVLGKALKDKIVDHINDESPHDKDAIKRLIHLFPPMLDYKVLIIIYAAAKEVDFKPEDAINTKVPHQLKRLRDLALEVMMHLRRVSPQDYNLLPYKDEVSPALVDIMSAGSVISEVKLYLSVVQEYDQYLDRVTLRNLEHFRIKLIDRVISRGTRTPEGAMYLTDAVEKRLLKKFHSDALEAVLKPVADKFEAAKSEG